MANSRYEYVKRFELADELLPEVWIVIRIDGRGFTKFSQAHEFEKPNDVRALCLMNASAKAVVEDQPDCIFAYGVSDEYSFVLRKSTSLYQRRASKLVSVFVSYFASNFVHRWPDFFPDKNLQYLPAFDGRAVCYPTAAILRDYLAWRQVDCHINNQYNACYWALVKSGATPAEAQATIKGTQADFKNELLFKRFGINYSTLPAIFRKGTSIYRKEVQKAPPAKKLRISGRGEKNTTASSPNNDSPPMTMEDKRNLSIALANMEGGGATGVRGGGTVRATSSALRGERRAGTAEKATAGGRSL
ncbi:tRNAHis guanylyltransferase [Klebsormidium nitens]|uniref:tRNA(His) guanylyltransferase n=1 Tax=Klebsormidium nitens TaxID=105231 RepID=A0A1Y1HXG7_KLENI|nr:tRNAHis guanylyltransferase [Klebsormidium nitens]|eukprot:GAQ82853.1 tRNAHis guanylyltransferase [Klebsormidium nitens]